MEENIQGNWKTIKCVEKEFTNGKIDPNIKENIFRIRNKVKESTILLMERDIKEIGKMGSSMVKEYKYIQTKRNDLEHGNKGKS